MDGLALDSSHLQPFVLLILFGYACGSIPFGLLFARLFCGIDPRTEGSKNIGTTNIARLCGKKWGAMTLLFDLGKGVVPVAVASRYAAGADLASADLFPLAAGALAIIGHMFPIWLKFKGGKGVATTVGVFFSLAPLPFLLAAALFLITVKRTGFVSAGSLVLSVSLPIILFLFHQNSVALLATLTGTGVIIAHRENIKRLIAGTEKPWKKPS